MTPPLGPDALDALRAAGRNADADAIVARRPVGGCTAIVTCIADKDSEFHYVTCRNHLPCSQHSRPVGRPPLDDPRRHVLRTRLSDAEMLAVSSAAMQAGYDRTAAWVRDVALAKAQED